MAVLTDRALRRKWTGKDEWLSDGGSRGAGRLVVKLMKSDLTFYYQYFLGDRKRFLPIGPYDLKAECGKTHLQARDLRRTCETMLAALGVSSAVRAQLQSHGLGSVQARHYVRHTYMDEKREALQRWEQHLIALVDPLEALIANNDHGHTIRTGSPSADRTVTYENSGRLSMDLKADRSAVAVAADHLYSLNQ